MKRFILIILSASTFIIKAQNQSTEPYPLLCKWMTGSFNSILQSSSDSDYYDIRLQMTRIWEERNDGYWIYVEQAVGTSLDKPYRQRIYQVIENKETGIFTSIVYEFENPLQYAGAWKDISKLASLNFEALQLRDGCEILLRYDAEKNIFVGKTDDQTCSSTLRGATHATSEVKIDATKLISWDRGWNEKQEQMWGAEKGGYIFMKE